MISCADPANPSRPPRHLAGFSFAPHMAASAARCCITDAGYPCTLTDPFTRILSSWRSLPPPCQHRWRAIGTPPRLPALCVDFHAGELVAESLRLAQNALGEITGDFSADDLLGKIFGSFCIGK